MLVTGIPASNERLSPITPSDITLMIFMIMLGIILTFTIMIMLGIIPTFTIMNMLGIIPTFTIMTVLV